MWRIIAMTIKKLAETKEAQPSARFFSQQTEHDFF
jgi:hypothetical protein